MHWYFLVNQRFNYQSEVDFHESVTVTTKKGKINIFIGLRKFIKETDFFKFAQIPKILNIV